MFKKAATLLLSGLLLLLSGCGFSGDVNSLLKAPKPTGELQDIQQALEQSITEEYTLRYPTDGEYRSAFVLRDLNGDDVSEAIAFYSTKTEDAVTVMHICLIHKESGRWEVANDLFARSSGIESVSFADINGDGTEEIFAGWASYGDAGRTLTVYSVSNHVMVQRLQESFTTFAVCNLTEDESTELLTVHIDAENKTSTAKLHRLERNGVVEIGKCQLDGNVSAYKTPVISVLKGGKPAVYIDAQKGLGNMITEVLVWNESTSALEAPFYDANQQENVLTLRSNSIEITDFNNDGVLDIPTLTLLPAPQAVTEADRIYVTQWRCFDGSAFSGVGRSLMNMAEGYYIEVPEKWGDDFTVLRRADQRQRVVYRWDYENAQYTDEVVRLQVFAIEEWEKNKQNYDSYVEIARNAESVYAGKVSDAGEMSLTIEELKKRFHFIA